jgi:hypothetical protein
VCIIAFLNDSGLWCNLPAGGIRKKRKEEEPFIVLHKPGLSVVPDDFSGFPDDVGKQNDETYWRRPIMKMP